jgi:signal transduction histidine kinase
MTGRIRGTVVLGAGGALGIAAGGLVLVADVGATQHAPTRAGIEVATAFVAGLAAWLLYRRARGGTLGRDLVLAWAIAMFVVVDVTFAMLPALLDTPEDAVLLRAEGIGRLLAAGALGVAALVPAERLQRARWCDTRFCALTLGAIPVGALVLAATLGGGALPQPETVPTWLLGTYALAGALLMAAGAGLAAGALRRQSQVHAWLAVGCLMGALAMLDAVVHPTATLDFISATDLLGLAAAVATLLGALQGLGDLTTVATATAVHEERRRIARELHDGLAQDLAYIVAQSARLAGRSDDPTLARVAEAATSALAESRLAITGLAAEPEAPLGPALARTAERVVVGRGGRLLRVDVDGDVHVTPAVQGDLQRIVQEAASNAVCHGDASEVSVRLNTDDGLTLQIADDGGGFAPGPRRPGGFGLASMRERAERAGARFAVSERPGGGTVVEVHLDG